MSNRSYAHLAVRKVLVIAGSLLFALSLSACRESSVPLPTATSTQPEPQESTPESTPSVDPSPRPFDFDGPITYAVAWVPSEEPLAIRQPAGITSMEVARLRADQKGLSLTGNSTQMGSSTWQEINLPDGGKGWINRWNLTEDVPRSIFCDDTRITELANKFIVAVQERDGEKLSELVNPRRGLVIRHDWWNPEVIFGYSSVPGLFLDPAQWAWGVNRDSEVTIDGTFLDVVVPQLEDVFSIAPELSCNELGSGSTAQDVVWPSEYTNINYISFYRPAPEPGSQLNWRTWALGIEYEDGEPYLSLLIQYRGEI